MSPSTFREIRRRAGLSQSHLAKVLRISDERSVRRWEMGEREISGPVTLLMELIDQGVINGRE